MTTETELNLYFTMLAHRKQQKRRDPIENIIKRCRTDADQVLRGIDNVLPVAPAATPPKDVLQSLPGIDILQYLKIRKI